MKKIFLLFSLFILLTIPLTGCRTESSLNIGLSYEEAILAKQIDGLWNQVTDAQFAKEDTIGLVLLNVSGFEKGEDGLNWMDIDVELKDAEGTIVNEEKSCLGESGKMDLENNIAKSPVGSFFASKEIPTGQYMLTVTVYDKIGGGKVVCNKRLYIE